ncbi:MAG: hypothetical protein QG656_468 [Candidatus Hydrogenedentes bacterium]|nr:hypothetical protein [Candidatus Hydrogenedentota bacterium]
MGIISVRNWVSVWRSELRDRRFLGETLLTALLFVVFVETCAVVLEFIEARPGVTLPDPILQLVGPIRLTESTFAILWVSLAVGFTALLSEPRTMLMAFQAATLVMVLRTVTLLLVPFEAVPTIIPLADPLIIGFGTGRLIIKDLFFSGHTSVMFLLMLTARKRVLRWIFGIGAVVVAASVVLQHVHYRIDVVIAPFVTYTSWRIVVVLHERPGRDPFVDTH